MTIAVLCLVLSTTPSELTLDVNGEKRTALVYAPSVKSPNPPLIFVFHGHGGNARNGARSMGLHGEWPEAVVVYGQGLPTKTPNDPEGKRNGWQIRVGQDGNRDLAYFDAVMASVSKSYGTDPKRVFAHGHSNGARFSYLLWAERGDKFRAFAASCSGGLGLINRAKPKPIFIIGGKTDAIVSFDSIQDTVAQVKKLNGTGVESPFGDETVRLSGKSGNDVVLMLHEGGHTYRKGANAQIVKFWKSVSS